MLRTALRPRWLALLAVVLVAASGMAWLGSWQLDRAHDRGRDRLEARLRATPVPLEQVLRPRQPFRGAAAERPVLASGRWDAASTLLVTDRPDAGRRGFWLLTPLLLHSGGAVPVVRGWVPDPGDPAATTPLPETEVRVRGVLKQSEAPVGAAGDAGPPLPPGQISAVDVTDLVKRWPHPLVTGYLIAVAEEPPVAGPSPRPVPVLAEGEGGLALQNLSYALQWWIFAAFGLFLWWRLVRDDARGDVATPASEAVGGGDAGPTGVGEDGALDPAAPGDRT